MNGETLKKKRAQHDITQPELAKKLGRRVETISRYENGREPIPQTVAVALEKIFQDLDKS